MIAFSDSERRLLRFDGTPENGAAQEAEKKNESAEKTEKMDPAAKAKAEIAGTTKVVEGAGKTLSAVEAKIKAQADKLIAELNGLPFPPLNDEEQLPPAPQPPVRPAEPEDPGPVPTSDMYPDWQFKQIMDAYQERVKYQKEYPALLAEYNREMRTYQFRMERYKEEVEDIRSGGLAKLQKERAYLQSRLKNPVGTARDTAADVTASILKSLTEVDAQIAEIEAKQAKQKGLRDELDKRAAELRKEIAALGPAAFPAVADQWRIAAESDSIDAMMVYGTLAAEMIDRYSALATQLAETALSLDPRETAVLTVIGMTVGRERNGRFYRVVLSIVDGSYFPPEIAQLPETQAKIDALASGLVTLQRVDASARGDERLIKPTAQAFDANINDPLTAYRLAVMIAPGAPGMRFLTSRINASTPVETKKAIFRALRETLEPSNPQLPPIDFNSEGNGEGARMASIMIPAIEAGIRDGAADVQAQALDLCGTILELASLDRADAKRVRNMLSVLSNNPSTSSVLRARATELLARFVDIGDAPQMISRLTTPTLPMQERVYAAEAIAPLAGALIVINARLATALAQGLADLSARISSPGTDPGLRPRLQRALDAFIGALGSVPSRPELQKTIDELRRIIAPALLTAAADPLPGTEPRSAETYEAYPVELFISGISDADPAVALRAVRIVRAHPARYMAADTIEALVKALEARQKTAVPGTPTGSVTLQDEIAPLLKHLENYRGERE